MVGVIACSAVVSKAADGVYRSDYAKFNMRVWFDQASNGRSGREFKATKDSATVSFKIKGIKAKDKDKARKTARVYQIVFKETQDVNGPVQKYYIKGEKKFERSLDDENYHNKVLTFKEKKGSKYMYLFSIYEVDHDKDTGEVDNMFGWSKKKVAKAFEVRDLELKY